MTTGKLLLYCQANITQRGGSFKTARLVVSYQSGIWQLLQQFICVTNKLLTEGMLNIVLKVTEVLHMRPNLAAFFLPQLGFIVEHPEGKPRCESHPAHGVFIGEGEPERSKPFPDGVHLFIGATGQRLTKIDQFILGGNISTPQRIQCTYCGFCLMNPATFGPQKGAGVAVGFWSQADEGQSGIRTNVAFAIVFYNLRGCLIQKLCNAEQIRRVEQNVFSFTATAATTITGKSEGVIGSQCLFLKLPGESTCVDSI